MKNSIKEKIDQKIKDGFLNSKDQLRFSTDYTDLSIEEIYILINDMEKRIEEKLDIINTKLDSTL
jgi:hypothetical protein